MSKIVTHHSFPPIPTTKFDWCAYPDGEEENGGYGYGPTERHAVNDLLVSRNEDANAIELTRGFWALVDDADLEIVSSFKWCASTGGYAESRTGGQHVLMHRLIMAPQKGMVVDHLNGHGFDNRRSNLRIATVSENLRNRPRQPNNKSGCAGVYWDAANSKWRAQIAVGRKTVVLGRFSDKADAIAARLAAETENGWSAADSVRRSITPDRRTA